MQLNRVQENLRKLNLLKKLKRGLTMFTVVDAIYQLGIRKKKIQTICGQVHFIDASECTQDIDEVPYTKQKTPPKEAGCLYPSEPPKTPTTTVPVSPCVAEVGL